METTSDTLGCYETRKKLRLAFNRQRAGQLCALMSDDDCEQAKPQKQLFRLLFAEIFRGLRQGDGYRWLAGSAVRPHSA